MWDTLKDMDVEVWKSVIDNFVKLEAKANSHVKDDARETTYKVRRGNSFRLALPSSSAVRDACTCSVCYRFLFCLSYRGMDAFRLSLSGMKN